MGPIGALLSGTVANLIGAPGAIALGAVVLMLFAAWVFGRREELRSL
jgi:hypothetical protein